MPATFTPRVVIASPDTFLAAVPHLLGFTPENSIVIAGIGESAAGHDEITLVQRFDRPDADIDSRGLGQIAHDAAVPIARTGAHQVIIAVISDTSYASPDELPQRDLVDRLVESFDDAGISTRDSLYTDGNSRWSYGCFDSGCCPPAGRVIPESVRTHVAAEFAAAGVAVMESRDSLVAELAPVDAERRQTVAAHLDALEHPGADLERWRDQEIRHVSDVLTSASVPTPEDCARVIASLDDIRVRDTVLWDLAQGRPDVHQVTANLVHVVRTAPDARVAPSATVLSIQQWTAGDGARANVALDRALSDDPDYSLGSLVGQSLRSGLSPATWRDLMRALPRQTCRHGDTPRASAPEIDAPSPSIQSPSLAG
jgi:hypothetical protein